MQPARHASLPSWETLRHSSVVVYTALGFMLVWPVPSGSNLSCRGYAVLCGPPVLCSGRARVSGRLLGRCQSEVLGLWALALVAPGRGDVTAESQFASQALQGSRGAGEHSQWGSDSSDCRAGNLELDAGCRWRSVWQLWWALAGFGRAWMPRRWGLETGDMDAEMGTGRWKPALGV